MPSAIALVLILLWRLGLVSSCTIGGFIHLLLVMTTILVFLRIIHGPACDSLKRAIATGGGDLNARNAMSHRAACRTWPRAQP
jgi:hypothetical protein